MLTRAEAMKNELAVPPEESVSVDGLIETVGGWLTVGDVVTESATLPEKPFRLKRDMVEFAVSPFPITSSVRLLPIANVGDGDCV